ncbi:uncharacterized protein LOC114843464 [Betta splendens]|uniref:Uncharacterized protein LOC114843464 n=1 Tax=Betta splendens TaxID=158456 RepID=A0A6P7KTT4_BETSP|nr:uncharacterized protein LOC114843464 [Betta splendens]
MVLKAFTFLIIVWNSSIFTSANNIYQLHFLLGCRAEIPCQHKKSDSNSFKWFYKKDEHSKCIQIFFEDKHGLKHHNPSHPSGSITHDRSFVINEFTEDDQGLYRCDSCYNKNCKTGQFIRVIKANLSETHETVYVTAGSSFTYSCPGGFDNYNGTFHTSYTSALGATAVSPETDYLTFSGPIQIENVRRADAGKYTFWVNKCNGLKLKICTLNLCVITVHHSGNSSVSCDVMCQVEYSYIRADNASTNLTGTQTIPVHVNPHGPLNCSTQRMMLHDTYTTVKTHAKSNASVKTTGTNTQHESLTAIIYGTSATITSLILLALFICYFRLRVRAGISDHSTGSDNNDMVEEETSIVYSLVAFTTPAKTTNSNLGSNDCVYSEIRV